MPLFIVLSGAAILMWLFYESAAYALFGFAVHHYHAYGPGMDGEGYMMMPGGPGEFLFYAFLIFGVFVLATGPLWSPSLFKVVRDNWPATAKSNSQLAAKLDALNAKLGPVDPLAGAPPEYAAALKAVDNMLAAQGQPTISQQAAAMTQARAAAGPGVGQ